MNDNIIGKRVNLLDQGWIELVDMLPHPASGISGDLAIVNAARTSFLGESKGDVQDKKLLFYLMKHHHCYHPDMEVLTLDGWKKWKDCQSEETFLIPDPHSGQLLPERLHVERFEIDDELVTYKNDRMSFMVTKEHRMWYRKKQLRGVKTIPEFTIYKAKDMPKWGHFDGIKNYKFIPYSGEKDPMYQFIGFFLGDGSAASTNRIIFHLKKQRKIEYLKDVLEKIQLSYTIKKSSSHKEGVVFWIEVPEWLREITNFGATANNKCFYPKLSQMKPELIRGLFDGLVNSDGSIKKDRPQIEYSSNSQALIDLFINLATLMGLDAHETSQDRNCLRCTAYLPESRTFLEARKQYFSEESYKGYVFCTTSSTGLLVVRGANNNSAFVCGNSTPFEMVEFKFRCHAPLVTYWHWARSRTWSFNASSGRYTEFEENAFYVPETWRLQSKNNKQASEGEVETDINTELTQKLLAHYDSSYALYQEALDAGVSREMARFFLPGFSVYYTWVLKVDAHNLMHFLKLRMAQEAQYEIRVYAEAIYEHFFKPTLPWTAEAFEQYRLSES